MTVKTPFPRARSREPTCSLQSAVCRWMARPVVVSSPAQPSAAQLSSPFFGTRPFRSGRQSFHHGRALRPASMKVFTPFWPDVRRPSAFIHPSRRRESTLSPLLSSFMRRARRSAVPLAQLPGVLIRAHDGGGFPVDDGVDLSAITCCRFRPSARCRRWRFPPFPLFRSLTFFLTCVERKGREGKRLLSEAAE